MKWIKKYPKFFVGLLIVIVIFGAIISQERNRVAERRLAEEIPNGKRSGQALEDTFYFNQLTDKERAAYSQMAARLKDFSGGVLEFDEPLTGEEYIRVTSAIENEQNCFYGFYEIPMSQDNIYLKYRDKDLRNIRDARISKTILFLSCADGINTVGAYAEDGTVQNLSAVDHGLSVNDEQKLTRLYEMQKEEDAVVEEILSGLPLESGEWDTISYFLDWMDENLSLYTELGEDAFSFTTMEEVLDHAYIGNNPVGVLDGRATSLGYAKLLKLLCNRAGIPAHIVMGAWGKNAQEGYVMCAAELSGETFYVDASGAKAAEIAGVRCLREQEVWNHMVPVDYFRYR